MKEKDISPLTQNHTKTQIDDNHNILVYDNRLFSNPNSKRTTKGVTNNLNN